MIVLSGTRAIRRDSRLYVGERECSSAVSTDVPGEQTKSNKGNFRALSLVAYTVQ